MGSGRAECKIGGHGQNWRARETERWCGSGREGGQERLWRGGGKGHRDSPAQGKAQERRTNESVWRMFRRLDMNDGTARERQEAAYLLRPDKKKYTRRRRCSCMLRCLNALPHQVGQRCGAVN
jgi:hypothetical protein